MEIFLSFQKERIMVMTRNPTREWNIKRPVKAYIQRDFTKCELIETIFCQEILIIYRAKLLKHDWLM